MRQLLVPHVVIVIEEQFRLNSGSRRRTEPVPCRIALTPSDAQRQPQRRQMRRVICFDAKVETEKLSVNKAGLRIEIT